MPPFEGLGITYDFHLNLIGKRIVNFLLVLIELLSLGVTAEAIRAKIDRKSSISLQHGQFDPKFQVEGGRPTNHGKSSELVQCAMLEPCDACDSGITKISQL